MVDDVAVDVADMELFKELLGTPLIDEDTGGCWCCGIGGTKYCGWNPPEPGGTPGGGIPEEECSVGVCGETEMGGKPPEELVGGGGVGRVAIFDEGWAEATEDGGGIVKDEELKFGIYKNFKTNIE